LTKLIFFDILFAIKDGAVNRQTRTVLTELVSK